MRRRLGSRQIDSSGGGFEAPKTAPQSEFQGLIITTDKRSYRLLSGAIVAILRAVQRSYFFSEMATRAGATYLDACIYRNRLNSLQNPPPAMADQSTPSSSDDSSENEDTAGQDAELVPPPLSEIGKDRPPAGTGLDDGSERASDSNALEDPARLRELQESLGRLEDFAAQSQAENTIRAYAADLEDFRHWCKKMDREWLPAEPKTVGLYVGARADELSFATLERRLAAIASLHKEEGYESPASVAEGPLRKIWKGLVREKTRRQDGAPPLLVEDLRSIIEHLPRYSTEEDGSAGELTLTSLRDRALLLVGWTGALRRSVSRLRTSSLSKVRA